MLLLNLKTRVMPLTLTNVCTVSASAVGLFASNGPNGVLILEIEADALTAVMEEEDQDRHAVMFVNLDMKTMIAVHVVAPDLLIVVHVLVRDLLVALLVIVLDQLVAAHVIAVTIPLPLLDHQK